MDSPRTRRVQRIALAQPVAARLGATPVLLVDIGVLGARVEHSSPLTAGAHTRLYFRNLVIDCRIVRSRLEQFHSGPDGETIYQSGLEFGPMAAETKDELKEFLAEYISRVLQEQRLNARRSPAAAKRSLVCYSWEDGEWRWSQTEAATQPAEGFTISTAEEPAQIELLCEAYERSDEDGRRLIRICAQLSIQEGGA